MQHPLSALLAVACVATATAQFPTIVPNGLAAVEGPGASEAPGDWYPLHMQSIYNRSVIAASGVIGRIDWRRDGSNVAFVAHSKQVTLWLSSQGVDLPEFTSSHFSYNRGTDHQQVFSGMVNYPAEPPVTTPPAAFTLQLPVSPTFALQAGNNLLVELVVQGTTFMQAGWKGDSTAGVVVTPDGFVLSAGNNGCPLTFVDTLVGNIPWPGAPLVVSSPSGATAVQPGVSVIGVNFPAPIDLTPIGAPGCALNQNPALMLPVTSNASGAVTSDWGKLPKDAILRGRFFNVQTFVVDFTFNALGIRASDGIQVTLGNGFPPGLDAHSWYNRRDNSAGLSPRADFRSTRSPVIQLN